MLRKGKGRDGGREEMRVCNRNEHNWGKGSENVGWREMTKRGREKKGGMERRGGGQ